ncbi:MAG: hypothetical protein WC518_00755 [Patescibacteria group bacterium]
MPDQTSLIELPDETKAEIIEAKPRESDDQTAVTIYPDQLKVKKSGNVIIGTLNVFISPARKRWHKHYSPQKNKYGYWHLIVDLLLAITIIFLIVFNLLLLLSSPKTRNDFSNSFISHGNYQEASTTETVPAAKTNLILSLVSSEKNIDLGQFYSYVLKYENRENFILKDLRLKAIFDERMIDGESVITWNKEQLPQLASVDPGQTGEIKFSIKTKKSLPQSSAHDKNFVLSSHVEAFYRNNERNSSPIFSTGQPLNQRISTESKVVAFARYYTEESDQLGFGPLPPQVGQPTRYWIFLNLENKYNDLNNLTISAQLPTNVSWTNRFSAANGSAIIYDPANKKINWNIDKVYAPSNFLPSVGAAFEIEIIPTEEQIGQPASLLENISLAASDDFTSELIDIVTPYSITTALSRDEFEKSDGKVQAK